MEVQQKSRWQYWDNFCNGSSSFYYVRRQFLKYLHLHSIGFADFRIIPMPLRQKHCTLWCDKRQTFIYSLIKLLYAVKQVQRRPCMWRSWHHAQEHKSNGTGCYRAVNFLYQFMCFCKRELWTMCNSTIVAKQKRLEHFQYAVPERNLLWLGWENSNIKIHSTSFLKSWVSEMSFNLEVNPIIEIS